ncbi:MAG: cupin domain-containing protein [Kiritimatiellae bacterium]|nr:cupin domain-containing protein [Kiritimatiellia bacterium]
MPKEKNVGKRIKMFRDKLKMTLGDLAAKSGVTVATIASIEDGEVLPALGVLTKLSRALGQRLGTFMDDQFKPDPIITRAVDLEAAKVAAEGANTLGYASHSLALGKPDRHMDPFRIEFAADGVDEVSSHEGEELIICIAGEVELTYGCEKTVLGPGDTAYYNSVVTHSLRALDGKPASIYGIVFLPF